MNADKKPRLRPLAGKCVVKPDESEKMTAGGVALPDSRDKPVRGTVLAVGVGKPVFHKDAPALLYPAVELAVGDVVQFPPFTGIEVELAGEKFKVMDQEQILAVVEE